MLYFYVPMNVNEFNVFSTIILNKTLLHGIFVTNRRVILWVDSVPSPGKSKILSDIKVRLHYSTV